MDEEVSVNGKGEVVEEGEGVCVGMDIGGRGLGGEADVGEKLKNEGFMNIFGIKNRI